MKRRRQDFSVNFCLGDLVKGDFDNDFIYTFSRAAETQQGSFCGDGPKFCRNDVGLVIGIISTPESFYSSGFCKLLFNSGEVGWLPHRWLIRVDDVNKTSRIFKSIRASKKLKSNV